MQSIFTLTQCKDNFGSHFNFCHHQVRSRGCKVFDGLAAEGGYHILQLAFGARIERRRREFNRVERDCESAVGRTKRHNVTFWGSRRVCACTCAWVRGCVGAWVRVRVRISGDINVNVPMSTRQGVQCIKKAQQKNIIQTRTYPGRARAPFLWSTWCHPQVCRAMICL